MSALRGLRMLRRGAWLPLELALRANFRAEEIEDRGAEGSAFTFISPAGRARLELSLAGRHNVTNALGALAAASEFGITAAEAARSFAANEACRDARRNFAFRRWIDGDQRLLQLEPDGDVEHD